MERCQPGFTGVPRRVKLDIKGVKPDSGICVDRVDAERQYLALYEKMGKPLVPTRKLRFENCGSSRNWLTPNTTS